MPPTSREFHRIARDSLAPTLTRLGFARPRGVGLGGWVREEPDGWLVIWLQLRRRTDPAETAAFTVEFRLSAQPLAGLAGPRARLPALLTDRERSELLALDADPARKAPAGPRLRTPGAIGGHDDPWFGYADDDDARRWLAFVDRVLPGALERFLATAASTR